MHSRSEFGRLHAVPRSDCVASLNANCKATSITWDKTEQSPRRNATAPVMIHVGQLRLALMHPASATQILAEPFLLLAT